MSDAALIATLVLRVARAEGKTAQDVRYSLGIPNTPTEPTEGTKP